MILEQFKVQSESNPDKYYVVSKVAGGAQLEETQWQCSCIGWTRHVPRRDCKHIAYHKSFGGIPVDPMLMAMLKVQRKEDKKANSALKEAA